MALTRQLPGGGDGTGKGAASRFYVLGVRGICLFFSRIEVYVNSRFFSKLPGSQRVFHFASRFSWGVLAGEPSEESAAAHVCLSELAGGDLKHFVS